GSEFAKLAWRNARDPGMSSLRWDSQSGEVSMRCAVIARPNDAGAPARRLCHAGLLQVGEALRSADALAVEMPGATLATPPAPIAGLPVVEQAETWQAYANEAPGLAEGLAEQVSRLANVSPAPWVRVTRAAHGLDAEIACAPPHQLTAPGQGMALLRISASQAHPQLGAGLVCVLVPPSETEPVPERAYATSALLNEAEAREWTGVDALGGWCVHPAAGLSHVAFFPALAVEEDTAEVLAWQAGMRARWATQFVTRVAAMRPAGDRSAS
ncbi:MAG: hypothetical protein ABL977_11565, partial [Candidatus Eisenbacteria bacterium]